MATKKTTEITDYDAELARLAGTSATLTEKGGGGQFFSIKSGQLAFEDEPLPGNQMCVVIAAWCLENVYYNTDYDPDNRAPPACFAFCKDPSLKDEMGPTEAVQESDDFEAQSPTCSDCPQNQWGSAERGRGKACSNRRRLACLPAGTYEPLGGRNGGFELALIDDEEHFRTADPAYLKVPVMSGKGFDAYVRDVADQFNKPLFAVYTRVSVVPDAKSQFKVLFELIEPVDDSLIPVLMDRYRKVNDEVDFPYTVFEDDEDAAPAPKASAGKKLTRSRAKPAAKRATTRKR